jgi:YD repeat-containing protein
MKRIISFSVLFLFSSSLLFGQYENMQLPKFLPPTPTAYQITKSADISVGMHTGTASLSIPLFEIQAGGGKIPLVLNYSSNGVTVDEVATRTGINWNLNIGGVISRTVLDEDDEIIPLKTPPANPYNLNQLADYFYPVSSTRHTETYNTQPDEYRFNVNGLSGKFFYDHNGVLRLTSYSNIKIEKNSSNTGSWKFKLTDAGGVLYTLGGPSATEKNKYSNMGCAKDVFSMQFSDVAYYLTKIEYPNGDYVNFTYGSYTASYVGTVAQTFIAKETPGNPGAGSIIWGSIPGSSATTCQSEMIQNSVMLQSVVCSNGTSVSFTYFNREDIPGEKGLETITQTFNGTTITRFKLIYEYSNSAGSYEDGYYNTPAIYFNRKRLFLKEVQNLGKEGTEILSTKIDYNDINGLPPRLSTAQDHFGYFNGKHNQFYVSLPPFEVNDLSICNESITPEALDFFSNAFTANIQADKEPDFNYSVKGSLQKITYATGGSTIVEWEPNTVNKFVTIYPPKVSNSMYALGTCSPGSNCEQTVSNNITVTYTQYLNLVGGAGKDGEDELHSTMIVKVTNLTAGVLVFTKSLKFNQSMNEWISLQGNATYKIELTSTTNQIPSGLTYTYRPGNMTQQYMNVTVPGLRVKKTTDNDGIADVKSKYYKYNSVASPAVSSGQNFSITNYSAYEHVVATGGETNYGVPYIDDYPINNYHKIQAGSNYKSYLSGNNSISYNAVVESETEDYSNGCIEHFFGSAYNTPGQLVYGTEIKNAPFADNSYMDGLENETRVYKKTNNALSLVSKTVNEYSTDPRNFSWYDVLVVQCKNASIVYYQFTPSNNPENLMYFDIMKYPRYSAWVHPEKVTNYTYDENGGQQVTQKTYTYDNLAIAQLGSETVTNSNGKVEKITYKYIKDYTSLSGLSSNTLAAASSMVSKNIVSPLIDKIITKDNTQLYKSRTNYKIWSGSVIQPEYLEAQVKSNAPETRILFNKYDASGNILEMQKADDVKESYIWGYGNLFPVAKIVGTGFDNAVQYVNTTTLNNLATTEQQMMTELNNLRNAFAGTNIQVTTYTYKPFVGISTETDPRGRTTTYTYDAFNRLTLIRDHEGNILKKICYNYAGQPENCQTSTLYYSTQVSQVFTRNNCTSCQTGGQVTYTVPAYTYSSSVSQADANQLAQNDIAANGQNYANANGSCTQGSNVNITYANSSNITGFTVTYTGSPGTFTFTIPSSGSGVLGCVPPGVYSIGITKAGNTEIMLFNVGCASVSSTGAMFKFKTVSSSSCNIVNLSIGQ